MKKSSKVIAVVLSLLLLIFIAVFAGLFLAIWDSDASVSEVWNLAFSKDVVVGDKIVISEPGFENVETGVTSDISDSDYDVLVGDKMIDPDIKSDESAEEAEADEDDTGIIFSDGNSSEDNTEEREPLRITSEISGIGTVVRAGAEEDSIENTLPVPSQINSSAENIDPQANYPLPMGEVDLNYFDDALFIGDSRVAGLAMNSGTNATFYAVTSFQLYRYKTFKVVQTPSGKVPIFDAMPYDKFTKIYIKVGLNELGTVTDEPFIEAYTSLINDLRAMQPRAIIYIQAILPVTQVKSQTDKTHCNENIRKRNENLKSFAELMKCYYVDVGPYFADETGALRAETTADGIHMYGKYMPEWIEALRQNAVAWPPTE